MITKSEISHIKSLLSNPQNYLEDRYIRFLPKVYPDYSKLTRSRLNSSTGEYCRFLIFPSSDGLVDIRIPLLVKPSDEMEHSCTIVMHKMFFHQNRLDTEFGPYFKDESNVIPPYNYKFVVKFAVDSASNKFCIISKSARSRKFLTPFNPSVRSQVSLFLTRVGIFRQNSLHDEKKIDIISYSGPNLLTHLQEVSFASIEDKDELVRMLLVAYHEQISLKSIIHKDIKPENICIDVTVSPYQITFIDFEDSYLIGETSSIGKGTPGYLAPELFINPAMCDYQLSLRACSESKLDSVLKANYDDLFTSETDIYALGCVLLNDVKLSSDSQFYSIARSMCALDPADRPRGACFRMEQQVRVGYNG